MSSAIAKYGEPVKITPLIKFSRWTALFLGLTYGMYRSKFLQRRADRLKEARDKRIAQRLENERLTKIQISKDSIKILEDITGAKF